MFTPKKDGTLSMTISFGSASSSRKNRIYYADLGENADPSSIDLSEYRKGSHSVIEGDITSAGDTVKSLDMTAGHTYILYTYQSGSTISALSYKYADTPATSAPGPDPTEAVTEAPATSAPAPTPTETAADPPATSAPSAELKGKYMPVSDVYKRQGIYIRSSVPC